MYMSFIFPFQRSDMQPGDQPVWRFQRTGKYQYKKTGNWGFFSYSSSLPNLAGVPKIKNYFPVGESNPSLQCDRWGMFTTTIHTIALWVLYLLCHKLHHQWSVKQSA